MFRERSKERWKDKYAHGRFQVFLNKYHFKLEFLSGSPLPYIAQIESFEAVLLYSEILIHSIKTRFY